MSCQVEGDPVELFQGVGIERPGARGQRDVDPRWRERAGRKALPQQFEALYRFGVARETRKLVMVGSERDQAGDQHREPHGRDGQGQARASQDDGTHPAVDALAPVGLLRGHRFPSGLQGPEGTSPEDGQDRRDEGDGGEHHQCDRDGYDRSQRLV